MHTLAVRVSVLALCATLGLAGAAQADMMPVPPPPPPPADFWARAIEVRSPQAVELHQHLATALRTLEEPWGSTDRLRVELVRRADRVARMLVARYPTDPTSLYYAGAFADLTGRSDLALGWLTEARERAPASALAGDAELRLGLLALRRGDLERAIAWLRPLTAVSRDRDGQVRASIALAFAHEAQGDTAAAIAALRVLDNPTSDDPGSQAIAVTLAVIYDRDDQVTNAFDLLVRLRQFEEGGAIAIVDRTLRAYPPPFALDRVYLRALAYDVTPGSEREAHRLWLQLEQSGGPPELAARARAHRLLLDRTLTEARRPRAPSRPQ